VLLPTEPSHQPPSFIFKVVLKYTVPEYKDSLHFFTKLAQRRGLHQKGGSPNVESAAKLVWSEWTG
jgi:nuclear GTP-binding protein